MSRFNHYYFCAALLAASGLATASEANSPTDCAAPDNRCQSEQTSDFSVSNLLQGFVLPASDVARTADAPTTEDETADRWQFSLTPSMSQNPDANSDISSQLTDAMAGALEKYAINSGQPINHIQVVSGMDALLHSLDEGAGAPSIQKPANNLLTNLLQNVGDIRVSATMPASTTEQFQKSEQELQAAINSQEVTQYLQKHNDVVVQIAKMLGWEQTGLMPSATDVQMMASAQLATIANSVERWSLKNVSITSLNYSLADNENQEGMVQMQWHSNSNAITAGNDASALSGSSLGANLRAMFGVIEY